MVLALSQEPPCQGDRGNFVHASSSVDQTLCSCYNETNGAPFGAFRHPSMRNARHVMPFSSEDDYAVFVYLAGSGKNPRVRAAPFAKGCEHLQEDHPYSRWAGQVQDTLQAGLALRDRRDDGALSDELMNRTRSPTRCSWGARGQGSPRAGGRAPAACVDKSRRACGTQTDIEVSAWMDRCRRAGGGCARCRARSRDIERITVRRREKRTVTMRARRGRGEGSITKRADGRWMARVDLGWQDAVAAAIRSTGRRNARYRTGAFPISRSSV